MNNGYLSEKDYSYAGIGYVRTRKSDSEIDRLVETLYARAYDKEVELLEVIVDNGSGTDIDREEIDRLEQWIENTEISVIFLRRLSDISRNKEELEKFVRRAETLGVSIYCTEEQQSVYSDSTEVYRPRARWCNY